MAQQKSGIFGYFVIALLVGGFGLFIYDVIFTAPDHRQGTIVEKIYVPPRSATAGSIGAVKRGARSVTSQQEEQWIAIVKMDTGETLMVHCLPAHYKTKNVGDVIRFKKYEGKLLHIDYFAHNEEED
jgi:hypothetical protein